MNIMNIITETTHENKVNVVNPGLVNTDISHREGKIADDFVCGAVVFEGGERIDLKTYSTDGNGNNGGGGKRKKIEGFSRKSRRRLFKKISAIDQTKMKFRPIFVTLTYPNEYPEDTEKVKRDIDAFNKRFNRKFKNGFYIWRLEFQKRGAPHYHLIVFNVSHIDKDWLSNAWYEVVGSGDEKHLRAGTKVERIRSWRGVWSYVSKYLGKEDSKDYDMGRIWAIVNKNNYKKSITKRVIKLTKREFYRIRRILARATNFSLTGYGRRQGFISFVKADLFSRLFDSS